MSRASLVELISKRDHVTKEQANDLINECAEALENGDSEAIQDYLGLEDDYIFDVLCL